MSEIKIVSAQKDKMDNPFNNGQRFIPLHDPLLGKEVMEPVQPPVFPLDMREEWQNQRSLSPSCLLT